MAGANDFRHLTMTGRLLADPEMRYLETGKAVLNIKFGNSIYDKGAEEDKNSLFPRVTIWERDAEFFNERLHKGDPILVSGPATIKMQEGKDGKTYLNVDFRYGTTVTLLGRGSPSEGDDAPRRASKPKVEEDEDDAPARPRAKKERKAEDF